MLPVEPIITFLLYVTSRYTECYSQHFNLARIESIVSYPAAHPRGWAAEYETMERACHESACELGYEDLRDQQLRVVTTFVGGSVCSIALYVA